MYQYHNGTLSIPARLLYEDLGLMTYDNYKKMCKRGKLARTKTGKGKGNEALVAFESLHPDYKKVIEDVLGKEQRANYIIFEDYICKDQDAETFFHNFTLPSGKSLPEKNIKEYLCNVEILNAIKSILNNTQSIQKALGSKVKPWDSFVKKIDSLPKHKYPHTLPKHARRLRDRYNRYIAEGYQSIVHNGFCHKNSERLSDEGKYWVLARWSDRVMRCTGYSQLLREYNKIAEDRGWKQLKSEQSLINFLTDPKIEALWYGYRFGELKSKEKNSYHHTTKLPSLRDSLWYSDGTKMNYYYQYADHNGKTKIGTCQVYEVYDTYSEVFLGYHISDSENFEAQYHAFKMALQVSGHKPYEIKFDNQGGTKKLEAQSFLSKISRLTTRTAPYNGKSKTIESAFGQFQTQYLKQDWFWTGQNIQTKKSESKANMEYIMANKENLPTLDQVKEIYKQRRNEWNQAPHSKTGQPRLEMYYNSVNPATPQIQIWDMIDMFWIQLEKPITCKASGIEFTHKGVEYKYMVKLDDGFPDIDWLAENIDKKFIVKYDPDDTSIIQLFEETPLGLRRVTQASRKTEIHRGRQEQEDWEQSFIKRVELKVKENRIARRDQMDAILRENKMHPEDYGHNSPALLGIESSRKAKKQTEFGKYQKELSNSVKEPELEYIKTDLYSRI